MCYALVFRHTASLVNNMETDDNIGGVELDAVAMGKHAMAHLFDNAAWVSDAT